MSSSDGSGDEDERKSLDGGSDNDGNNDPLTEISDPRETDVLCGRGGAALRREFGFVGCGCL